MQHFRYELDALGAGTLDTARATHIAAAWPNVTAVRTAYPFMGTWRGTNQPRTVAFTVHAESQANCDSTARAIAREYSRDQPHNGQAMARRRTGGFQTYSVGN